MITALFLSFYIIVLGFFLSVIFRLHGLSSAFIIIMTVWIILVPFVAIALYEVKMDKTLDKNKKKGTGGKGGQ